jgi:hypothetical protein
MVITTSYSSQLKNFLTLPVYGPPIRTLSDIAHTDLPVHISRYWK